MDLWPVLFVVGMIVLIVLIILGIAELYASPIIPIGPACINDASCQDGYRCENGQCRAPIGGPCALLSDCTFGAVACANGVCVDQPRNNVGQPCPCREGLVCRNGFCRVPTGGTCMENSDCVNGDICMRGVCAIGPTGGTACYGETENSYYHHQPEGSYCPPEGSYYSSCGTSKDSSKDFCPPYYPEPPQIYNYPAPRYEHEVEIIPCLTTHDCPTGYLCAPRCVYQGYNNGRMLPLIGKEYLPGENALDVAVHQDTIYVLLEGGDIIRVTDHVPIRIETSVYITRIFSFTGYLYGLSEGKLYSLVEVESRWEPVNSISGLIEASVTTDGEYLWLETSNEGYLYDRKWQLVERVGDKRCLRRIYGHNKESWIEIHTDYIFHNGKKYPRVKACGYYPDGRPFLPRDENIFSLRLCQYRGEYVVFFILDRGCIPV